MKDLPETELPVIHLSLLTKSTVCIHRDHSVNDFIWMGIETWWKQECGNVVSSQDTIEIPLISFIRFIQWLRTHWSVHDRTYTVSPELTAAVNNIKMEGKRFDDLLNNTASPTPYDFSDLKLKRKPTPFQKDNIKINQQIPPQGLQKEQDRRRYRTHNLGAETPSFPHLWLGGPLCVGALMGSR